MQGPLLQQRVRRAARTSRYIRRVRVLPAARLRKSPPAAARVATFVEARVQLEYRLAVRMSDDEIDGANPEQPHSGAAHYDPQYIAVTDHADTEKGPQENFWETLLGIKTRFRHGSTSSQKPALAA